VFMVRYFGQTPSRMGAEPNVYGRNFNCMELFAVSK